MTVIGLVGTDEDYYADDSRMTQHFSIDDKLDVPWVVGIMRCCGLGVTVLVYIL